MRKSMLITVIVILIITNLITAKIVSADQIRLQKETSDTERLNATMREVDAQHQINEAIRIVDENKKELVALKIERDNYKLMFEQLYVSAFGVEPDYGSINPSRGSGDRTTPAAITKTPTATSFVESENERLRQTIANMAASRGSETVNTVEAPDVANLGDYTLVKPLGNWLLTYYSPSKEQCGNTKAIGASGAKVLPGYSCAIDPAYWKFGTMFYVEGYGIVEAVDIGSAIKGKLRMDICVYNSDVCDELGAVRGKVWLIKKK